MLDLDSLRGQGEAAWTAGHWEPARAAYASIIEQEPDDVLARQRWLDCLRALGSTDEALDVAEALLDRLEQRGQTKGALIVAESLLNISENPERPLRRCLRLHFALEDQVAGLGCIRQLSDWHLERGRVPEALAVLRECEAQYPQCVDIGMELGHLLIALGRVEEGTEQFRQLAHRTLDLDVEEAMEAFRRWDFLKRLAGEGADAP